MREARKTSAGMRSWMTDSGSSDAKDNDASQKTFASGSNPLAARAFAGQRHVALGPPHLLHDAHQQDDGLHWIAPELEWAKAVLAKTPPRRT